tara:strand:- start:10667 stop:11059 length:393 start_codon:yes stop_codon:yes gene_type:complete
MLPLQRGKQGKIGFRMAQDPRLLSQKVTMRARWRLDPLKDIFGAEVVPLLQEAPGLRPVAVFDEILRGHPELCVGIKRRWNAASGHGGPKWPRTGCDIGLHTHEFRASSELLESLERGLDQQFSLGTSAY